MLKGATNSPKSETQVHGKALKTASCLGKPTRVLKKVGITTCFFFTHQQDGEGASNPFP